ncbi:unnamed protein product, partial [Brenthis ino]
MFKNEILDLDASEVPLDIFRILDGFNELDPNVTLGQIQMDFVPVSPTGPPSTKEFTTDVNFRVEIDGSKTHKKKFLYSHKLNCLFLNTGHNFSINFQWDITKVLHPVYVRTTVVFSDPCDAEKRVQTCYQHSYVSPDDSNALPENIRHNVLRSGREVGAPDVFYCGAPASADSWYSVLVRFPAPSSHAFHFVCRNSCSSGINRRPLSLVFTLESAAGDVYGRQVVGVRVCGCPKRDLYTAELAQSSENPKSGKRKAKTETTDTPTTIVSSTTPSRKRIKLEDSECDTLVTLPAITVPGTRVALAGLRVMRDMLLQTRAVQLRARPQQDVRAVERGLAELMAAEDAVRRGGGAGSGSDD